MATVKDILDFIETVAPPYMKEDWDNVGLNCGHADQEVTTILVVATCCVGGNKLVVLVLTLKLDSVRGNNFSVV